MVNHEEESEYVGILESGFKFQNVAIREEDLIYVTAVSPRMQEDSLPFAIFYGYDAGEFGLIDDVKWNCVAVCAPTFPNSQMLALGEYGQVYAFGSDDQMEERITGEELEFRDIRVVDGKAYACAMDRKVFRRDAPDQWVPIHGKMDQASAPDTVFGFESIHGTSERDLYAVGWHGEIWHCSGKTWKQETSPTTILLNRVYCAPDGYSYACGLVGTLLRGREGQWAIIAEDSTKSDLWDLAWFDGKLWVSSMDALYTLEGDQLEPVEFDDDVPGTCYSLDAREGILWSVGSNDIFQFDGDVWSRIA
jgi:hypothetical protein